MPRRRVILFGLLATISIPFLGGCQRVLFPSDEPRTQYEVHDRLRNRFTPLEEPDAFGHPQPALRARLSQRRG